MLAAFELWETRSGNLMGTYETEDQALTVLIEAVRSRGEAYLETFALIREKGRGRSQVVAVGKKLAERVLTQERSAAPAG